MPFKSFFCLSCAIFFLLSSCSNVFAQSPASATKNTIRQANVSPGVDTVRIGNIDCRLTPCGSDIIDRAINQHPTVNTDGGMPKVSGSGSIKNPSGKSVPVGAAARVSGAAAAKAIGRAAAKILPGISTAIAIKELAEELGFKLGKNPDGSDKYEKADPAVCTVAPCFEFRINGAYGDTGWMSGRESAAQAYAVKANAYFKANGFLPAP